MPKYFVFSQNRHIFCGNGCKKFKVDIIIE